jgi:hypothetical protein
MGQVCMYKVDEYGNRHDELIEEPQYIIYLSEGVRERTMIFLTPDGRRISFMELETGETICSEKQLTPEQIIRFMVEIIKDIVYHYEGRVPENGFIVKLGNRRIEVAW